MSNTTLIDRHRYNDIVKTLLKLSAHANDEKPTMKEKRLKKYLLLSNVKNRCLHRQGPTGNWPTFEEIFDILKYHHEKLCHTKVFSKNKNELDKVWYSMP
jgi:hypothetical protein